MPASYEFSLVDQLTSWATLHTRQTSLAVQDSDAQPTRQAHGWQPTPCKRASAQRDARLDRVTTRRQGRVRGWSNLTVKRPDGKIQGEKPRGTPNRLQRAAALLILRKVAAPGQEAHRRAWRLYLRRVHRPL